MVNLELSTKSRDNGRDNNQRNSACEADIVVRLHRFNASRRGQSHSSELCNSALSITRLNHLLDFWHLLLQLVLTFFPHLSKLASIGAAWVPTSRRFDGWVPAAHLALALFSA